MNIGVLPWKDISTIGAAWVGAVLGVVNIWNAINQRRIRLRVKPVHTLTVPDGAFGFGIEVVNLSAFPLTIEEAGLWLDGKDKGRRFAIRSPIITDGGSWPRRLEPRGALTLYFNPRDTIHARSRIRKAYIRTACGSYVYGTSPALKDLARAK